MESYSDLIPENYDYKERKFLNETLGLRRRKRYDTINDILPL